MKHGKTNEYHLIWHDPTRKKQAVVQGLILLTITGHSFGQSESAGIKVVVKNRPIDALKRTSVVKSDEMTLSQQAHTVFICF